MQDMICQRGRSLRCIQLWEAVLAFYNIGRMHKKENDFLLILLFLRIGRLGFKWYYNIRNPQYII